MSDGALCEKYSGQSRLKNWIGTRQILDECGNSREFDFIRNLGPGFDTSISDTKQYLRGSRTDLPHFPDASPCRVGWASLLEDVANPIMLRIFLRSTDQKSTVTETAVHKLN